MKQDQANAIAALLLEAVRVAGRAGVQELAANPQLAASAAEQYQLGTFGGRPYMHLGESGDTDWLALGDYQAKQVTYAEQFGVVVGGETDNTEALAAAIAYRKAHGGGAVILPAGTILVDELLIPANTDGLVIVGAGEGDRNSTVGTRIKARTAGAHLLKIGQDVIHLQIRDLILDGDSKVDAILDFDTAENTVIDYVRFSHVHLANRKSGKVTIRHVAAGGGAGECAMIVFDRVTCQSYDNAAGSHVLVDNRGVWGWHWNECAFLGDNGTAACVLTSGEHLFRRCTFENNTTADISSTAGARVVSERNISNAAAPHLVLSDAPGGYLSGFHTEVLDLWHWAVGTAPDYSVVDDSNVRLTVRGGRIYGVNVVHTTDKEIHIEGVDNFRIGGARYYGRFHVSQQPTSGVDVGVFFSQSLAHLLGIAWNAVTEEWGIRSYEPGYGYRPLRLTASMHYLNGGHVRMDKLAEPSAPPADTGILYFRDNGSGKGQLCVRFPTGAVQVLATEP